MIVIIGAGISGLICALELAKKGFKVVIYEQNNIPGGMAKSYRINNIPTEHSWRGFMSFYRNIFDVLKQLKCEQIEHYYNDDDQLFTIDDVKKHNKPDDAWVIFRGYVYDITYFIDEHPGGIFINNALGNDVEEVWNTSMMSWHLKHKEVINAIKKNKVGRIRNQIIENFNCKSTLKPIKMNKLFNEKKQYNKFEGFKQTLNLIYEYSKFFCGNLRNKSFYQIPLIDIIKPKTYLYDHFVTYMAGPGLGFDFNNASIGHMFFYINGYLKRLFDKDPWFVTDRPTNEAFIEPLVELLKSYDVEINYGSTLNKINVSNNKIQNIVINDENIIADEYIIAINPIMIIDILNNSNQNHDFDQMIEQHKKLKIINNQISFRLGFNKKINFNELNCGYVLMDSINNITFYSQDDFISSLDSNEENKIKSLWSGTCVQVYNNNMTKEQFIENIINQFIECVDLQREIKTHNDFCLTRDCIIYTEIFDEWTENNGKLVSKYPKFVNTFFNEPYKPNQITNFDNLYLAGAHTNTSFKIWSMESACESGKIVANLLLKKYNKPLCDVYTHKPMCISKFDDMLYKKGYPSLINILLLLFIVWIILYVLYKNKK